LETKPYLVKVFIAILFVLVTPRFFAKDDRCVGAASNVEQLFFRQIKQRFNVSKHSSEAQPQITSDTTVIHVRHRPGGGSQVS
jgi:hypothetical protein